MWRILLVLIALALNMAASFAAVSDIALYYVRPEAFLCPNPTELESLIDGSITEEQASDCMHGDGPVHGYIDQTADGRARATTMMAFRVMKVTDGDAVICNSELFGSLKCYYAKRADLVTTYNGHTPVADPVISHAMP